MLFLFGVIFSCVQMYRVEERVVLDGQRYETGIGTLPRTSYKMDLVRR